jgi:acetyl esterase
MTQVTLDPSLQAVVDATRGMTSIDLDSLPRAEALGIARPQFPARPAPPHSEDRLITGCEGADLRLRLYFPENRTTRCPVVLYLHGGGFVGGSIEMDDTRCVRLASAAACIVASLDYRLAPESPFPAAIEDAFTAWRWIIANAPAFGGDEKRCAIYGSSSGGHIAVGAMLLARVRGAPMPQFQLLVNPALDPAMSCPSYREFSEGPFMTRARMAWYWQQYASGGEVESNPLWAPLAAVVAGLPPAHVITAELDVLRDEGEAYAAHLRAAGIDVTMERYPGMIHGFMTVLPDHDASLKALKSSAAALRQVFGQPDH